MGTQGATVMARGTSGPPVGHHIRGAMDKPETAPASGPRGGSASRGLKAALQQKDEYFANRVHVSLPLVNMTSE